MQVHTLENQQPVIDYVAQVLQSKLQDNARVTWLIPGGSAIAVAAAVSHQLTNMDLSRLSVTLTDERFGIVGHPESNWMQLEHAGFSLPGATLVPVLTGKELGETVDDYVAILHTLLDTADYAIGVFGIGADGHTAGILPDSPATIKKTYAVGYEAAQFTRITMTFPAIKKLHESVVYACGSNKLPALQGLVHERIALTKQPAQIHKLLPKSTLFTNQEIHI